MVEKVNSSSQNAYLKQRFEQFSNIEQGESRVIKSGESLWNIAKSNLGKGAKNSEINDYVLQIAKLNGLDTVEKMNNISANTTIYLPKKETSKNEQVTPKQENVPTNTQIVKPKLNRNIPEIVPQTFVHPNDGTRVARTPFLTIPQNNKKLVLPKPEVKKKSTPALQQASFKPKTETKPKVEPKPKVTPKAVKIKNEPEQDFEGVINTVLTDKSIRLVDAHVHLIDNGEKLYHVVNNYERNGFKSNSHPVLSFTINQQGNIRGITFEGRDNINPYGYDYEIKHDGKNPAQIRKTPYLTTTGEKVGNVSQEDMHKLYEKLQNLANAEQ